MDDLSAEQYEKVLQYMQSVGEEDFSSAAAALHQHDFNLPLAINRRFQPPARPSFAEGARQQPGDEQVVRRYIDFSRRRNQEWSMVAVLLDIVKYILGGILRLLLGLLPTSIATRYFGSPFEKAYFGRIRQHYAHRPFSYFLPKTKNLSSKSVLLLLSPRAEHPEVTAILNNTQLRRKIDQNFFLTCYVVESADLAKVPGSKEAPQLIALRWNIFQEIVQVGRERNLKGFNGEQLGRWAHEGRNLFKRDGNVLVKFRNYVARANGIHYQQEQEEEVSLTQRQMERQEIHQQNQAYQQIEEATRRSKQEQAQRRLKEEQEERMREELLQERRLRKMSIPDEPTSGPIIRLSFRCPDGSTIIRNFQSDEKVQLIFHWVQLNDAIGFQDEKRQFQIMYSYPPVPLSSQKHKLLKDVFQSQQEKVLIREI